MTVPLSAALDKDRVNHAYLFSGPRGCGKTTSARILARCLNCAQGPDAHALRRVRLLRRPRPRRPRQPRRRSRSTRPATAAWTTPASLRERAVFAPARDRYKVFIIDEAHMVSTQGFNALLKIVEEPPPHVRFVFATTEPEKVIGTIRSRTHHYPFRLVPPGAPAGLPRRALRARGRRRSGRACCRSSSGRVRGPCATRCPCSTSSSPAPAPDGLDVRARGRPARLHRRRAARRRRRRARRRGRRDGLPRRRPGDRVRPRAAPLRRGPARAAARPARRRAVPGRRPRRAPAAPADQLERMRGQAARFGRAELSRAADVVNAAPDRDDRRDVAAAAARAALRPAAAARRGRRRARHPRPRRPDRATARR